MSLINVLLKNKYRKKKHILFKITNISLLSKSLINEKLYAHKYIHT